MSCFSWHDPGPCPVDDTPHTACTPESVGTVTTRAYRPRVLDIKDRPVQPEPLATFSTKEYRRKMHGAAIRKAIQQATRKERPRRD